MPSRYSDYREVVGLSELSTRWAAASPRDIGELLKERRIVPYWLRDTSVQPDGTHYLCEPVRDLGEVVALVGLPDRYAESAVVFLPAEIMSVEGEKPGLKYPSDTPPARLGEKHSLFWLVYHLARAENTYAPIVFRLVEKKMREGKLHVYDPPSADWPMRCRQTNYFAFELEALVRSADNGDKDAEEKLTNLFIDLDEVRRLDDIFAILEQNPFAFFDNVQRPIVRHITHPGKLGKGTSIFDEANITNQPENILDDCETSELTAAKVEVSAEGTSKPLKAQAVITASAKRKYAVTAKETANYCSVKVRTVQNWDAGKGTPAGYPGRGDRARLIIWSEGYKQETHLKARATAMNHAVSMDPADLDSMENRSAFDDE